MTCRKHVMHSKMGASNTNYMSNKKMRSTTVKELIIENNKAQPNTQTSKLNNDTVEGNVESKTDTKNINIKRKNNLKQTA